MICQLPSELLIGIDIVAQENKSYISVLLQCAYWTLYCLDFRVLQVRNKHNIVSVEFVSCRIVLY